MQGRIIWLVLSVIFAVSCRASVNAEANLSGSANGNEEGLEDFDKPLDAEQSQAFAEESGMGMPATLASARHDLALAAESNSPKCQCLAAAIGDAKDPAFRWTGEAPSIDPTTQLVIAFTSAGVSCADEPKGSLGASYWGYRISGNDIVVFVEGARAGRPRTEGAVIPKPVGSGQVYLEPINKKLPYGHALDGTATRCKLGNVPPERGVAFSNLETGIATPSQSGSSDF